MWLLEHPPRGRFMPRRSSILEAAAAARTKSRSCRRTRREGRHNRARASMNSNLTQHGPWLISFTKWWAN